MAFEQQNPNRPFFESRAFIGTLAVILIIAILLFVFRNQIAAKIADWRGDKKETTQSRPALSVAPAASTPTPTATAATTPTPTSTATNTGRATSQPNAPVAGTGTAGSTTSDNLPQSGPGDVTALLASVGTIATLGTARLRQQIYRRRVKKQLSKLDIAS